MKTKTYKFSRDGIINMPAPERDWILYPDNGQGAQKYLYVRVTRNGARSFMVDKNSVERGRVRITLGPAGTDAMTAVQAREQARIALGLMEEGYTPDKIKDRLQRAEDRIPEGAVTLNQVLEKYLAERKHKLAARTVADYRKLVKVYLSDWQHRPIEAIDEAAVTAKFTSINSPSRANYAFRLVRALFNYARSIKDDNGAAIVEGNPVEVLSQRRIWHDDKQRREVIELAGLPAWWKAVNALGTSKVERTDTGRFAEGTASANDNGETVSDFLIFLLLTGLRRNEAATLKWENVDLAAKMFTVPMTKNRIPHTLPLSDYLYSMLKRRHAAALKQPENSHERAYVFAGGVGPLAEPKKQIAKVVAGAGVAFSSHTLRRTFASIAESLDIPYLALKRLLNHKAQDVTGKHYTVIGVERLRKPMQQITDFILRAAKARKSAPVVKLPQSKAA
jgi:integrase